MILEYYYIKHTNIQQKWICFKTKHIKWNIVYNCNVYLCRTSLLIEHVWILIEDIYR